ncbi:MAG: hypothetical protein KA169_03300 [Burkholderiaceae bacterium]|nr:hypothetical protein [Burkholderiaceae bacterium]
MRAAPGRGAGLLAPLPAGTRVLLLAGGRERTALSMKRWAAQRPPAERWALVRAGGDALAEPMPPELDVVDFSGGCACCVAASAFSLTIARLLRRGTVDRLFILLAESADPGAVADALWSGPLAGGLAGVEIVGVMASDTPQRLLAATRRAGLGAADVLLLDSLSDPQAVPTLQASLSLADTGADPDIVIPPPAGLDWVDLRSRLDAVRDPARWRWLSGAPGRGGDGSPTPAAGDDRCHRWVWPAAASFDRRQAEAALRALAGHPALTELRAVIRTRREWYGWGGGAPATSWAPTVSRRESRIECRIRSDVPIDLAAVASAWEAALAP